RAARYAGRAGPDPTAGRGPGRLPPGVAAAAGGVPAFRGPVPPRARGGRKRGPRRPGAAARPPSPPVGAPPPARGGAAGGPPRAAWQQESSAEMRRARVDAAQGLRQGRPGQPMAFREVVDYLSSQALKGRGPVVLDLAGLREAGVHADSRLTVPRLTSGEDQ